jgi:hypothetical protein
MLFCVTCCAAACFAVQLRTAFALATVLNRTLILPPLWCGLDRYWAPHAGTLPGSTFKLPFLCPADHVLDLESEWTSWRDTGSCFESVKLMWVILQLGVEVQQVQGLCQQVVRQARLGWVSGGAGQQCTELVQEMADTSFEKNDKQAVV